MSYPVPEVTRVHMSRVLREILPMQAGDAYVNDASDEILSTVIGKIQGSSQVTANQVLQRYEPVIQMGDDTRGAKWISFQDLLDKLFNFKSLEQVVNYLAFLNSLNHDHTAHNSSSETEVIPSMRQSTRYGSLNFSAGSSSSSVLQDQTNFRASSFTMGGKTLDQLVEPYYYGHQGALTDGEILKYLSYTLLGSPSKLFPFTSDGAIQLPANVNPSIRGVLHCLLEPGILYRFLATKFEQLRLDPSLSQIKIAFVTNVMSTYLTSYVRLVNSIFNERNLTLKSIHLELYDEIIKLRFIHYLTSHIKETGPQFLYRLYVFSDHGDKLIRDVASNLFAHSAIPYHDTLSAWITRGEIVADKQEEFFVQDISSGYEKSLKDYILVPEKVPKFYPIKVATQMFQIGKSIVFLRYYCKELKWLHGFTEKYNSIISGSREGINGMDMDKFASIVEAQYEEVINYSCSKIYGDFKVIQDLAGINDVLIRKGDLTDSLIRNGGKVLSEPSNSLTSHKLNRLLNEAIEDSSVKQCNQDLIDKIDARVLSHGTIGFDSFTLDYRASLPLIFEDSIKEYLRLFNFFFKVRRIAYNLNEWWLESTSFKDINSFVKRQLHASRKDKNPQMAENIQDYVYAVNHVKKLSIVTFNMTKFVNSILMFFHYEIVEKNFNKLMDAFEAKDEKLVIKKDQDGRKHLPNLSLKPEFLAKIGRLTSSGTPKAQLIRSEYKDLSIDEIIDYHQEYVKNISRNRLLDSKATAAKGKVSGLIFIHQLNHLLSICDRFLALNEEFYINIYELVNALTTSGLDDSHVEALKKKLDALNSNLYDVLYQFKGSLDVFKNDLLHDDDAQAKALGIALSG